MSRPRVILHIDLDCFYAQVESIRLGIPQDEPLAVQQWGSLLAVNYAARKFNIKRSENISEAKQKCPSIHLVRSFIHDENKIFMLPSLMLKRLDRQIRLNTIEELKKQF